MGTRSTLAGAEPVWTSIQLFGEMFGPIFCVGRANGVKETVPAREGLVLKRGGKCHDLREPSLGGGQHGRQSLVGSVGKE